jgi:hypothetical protein
MAPYVAGLTDNSVGFPAIHDDESAPNAPLDGSEAAQVNNIRYLALDREGRRCSDSPLA